MSLSKKEWYVYDRYLAGINILLYCTKIFLNFALKDYCLWTLCSALFCFLCRLLHLLICMYYLGTFSKYGKYFTQLSSKVEIEKDFFSSCLIPWFLMQKVFLNVKWCKLLLIGTMYVRTKIRIKDMIYKCFIVTVQCFTVINIGCFWDA